MCVAYLRSGKKGTGVFKRGVLRGGTARLAMTDAIVRKVPHKLGNSVLERISVILLLTAGCLALYNVCFVSRTLIDLISLIPGGCVLYVCPISPNGEHRSMFLVAERFFLMLLMNTKQAACVRWWIIYPVYFVHWVVNVLGIKQEAIETLQKARAWVLKLYNETVKEHANNQQNAQNQEDDFEDPFAALHQEREEKEKLRRENANLRSQVEELSAKNKCLKNRLEFFQTALGEIPYDASQQEGSSSKTGSVNARPAQPPPVQGHSSANGFMFGDPQTNHSGVLKKQGSKKQNKKKEPLSESTLKLRRTIKKGNLQEKKQQSRLMNCDSEKDTSAMDTDTECEY